MCSVNQSCPSSSSTLTSSQSSAVSSDTVSTGSEPAATVLVPEPSTRPSETLGRRNNCLHQPDSSQHTAPSTVPASSNLLKTAQPSFDISVLDPTLQTTVTHNQNLHNLNATEDIRASHAQQPSLGRDSPLTPLLPDSAVLSTRSSGTDAPRHGLGQPSNQSPELHGSEHQSSGGSGRHAAAAVPQSNPSPTVQHVRQASESQVHPSPTHPLEQQLGGQIILARSSALASQSVLSAPGSVQLMGGNEIRQRTPRPPQTTILTPSRPAQTANQPRDLAGHSETRRLHVTSHSQRQPALSAPGASYHAQRLSAPRGASAVPTPVQARNGLPKAIVDKLEAAVEMNEELRRDMADIRDCCKKFASEVRSLQEENGLLRGQVVDLESDIRGLNDTQAELRATVDGLAAILAEKDVVVKTGAGGDGSASIKKTRDNLLNVSQPF